MLPVWVYVVAIIMVVNMKTSEEIANFVEDVIYTYVHSSHTVASRAEDLDSLFFSIDLVRRFIKGERNPWDGLRNAHMRLGLPATISLVDYAKQRLEEHGNACPTEREVMKALAEIWTQEVMK
jgi:hypothetical protein